MNDEHLSSSSSDSDIETESRTCSQLLQKMPADMHDDVDIIQSKRGTKFISKIPGIRNGAPLKDIVVVSDQRSKKAMYLVYREWLDLPEGLVYLPELREKRKRVPEKTTLCHELIRRCISRNVRDTTCIGTHGKEIQISLKWVNADVIHTLFKDFGMLYNILIIITLRNKLKFFENRRNETVDSRSPIFRVKFSGVFHFL